MYKYFRQFASASWEAANGGQFDTHPLMSMVKISNLQPPISDLKVFLRCADAPRAIFDIHYALRISGCPLDPLSSTVPNPTIGNALHGTSDLSC